MTELDGPVALSTGPFSIGEQLEVFTQSFENGGELGECWRAQPASSRAG